MLRECFGLLFKPELGTRIPVRASRPQLYLLSYCLKKSSKQGIQVVRWDRDWSHLRKICSSLPQLFLCVILEAHIKDSEEEITGGRVEFRDGLAP